MSRDGGPRWLMLREGAFPPFRSDADLLRQVLGSARESHPEEYADILDEMRSSGVEIIFRRGEYAYSPQCGRPGRLIIDQGASLGALRHEFRHFLDVRDAGYPGLGFYLHNPREFARLERRGYHEEIAIARRLGRRDVAQAILLQMRQRVREVLGT